MIMQPWPFQLFMEKLWFNNFETPEDNREREKRSTMQ
jgi:hypothetical protein